MTPTVRGRRLPLSRLIITILVTVLLAPLATIAAGSAQAADRDADGIRHWRPWICTWADDAVDAKPTTIESAEGVIVLDENLLCWLAAPKEDTTDVPANPVLDSAIAAFLNRTGMSLDAARESQLAAVLCHDGALGTSSLANGLPSVKEVTQACTKPTVPAGAAGFGDGSGRESGFLPDLFGAGAGMPSASSISCSAAGAANPWSDGVDGGTYQPKTSDGEIAGTLAASWFSGVAVIYGSAKGAGGATSTAGGVLAGGAGSAGIVAWGNGASSALGNLMDSRYRDQAQSLASDAQHWAQAAEANAQAAEGFAAASGDPNAAAEAAKARQAAEDAKKAAAEAAAAAKKAAEAKSRAEAAAAYAAAKKADEDAKKRADDASKAKQGAQNAANNSSGSGAPVNPGTSTGTGSGGSKGTTNGTPLTTGESACETLRREVAECEQSGWRSFSCQELARMISGCTLDPKIALVDSDGAVCGTPTVSTEEVISALRESCGMLVAHPMPGVDPCALTVEGSPEIRGGWIRPSPTVAARMSPMWWSRMTTRSASRHRPEVRCRRVSTPPPVAVRGSAVDHRSVAACRSAVSCRILRAASTSPRRAASWPSARATRRAHNPLAPGAMTGPGISGSPRNPRFVGLSFPSVLGKPLCRGPNPRLPRPSAAIRMPPAPACRRPPEDVHHTRCPQQEALPYSEAP